MAKERHIRLGGGEDFKVCPHIIIDGVRSYADDGCEYEQHFTIKCRVCKKVFRFVDHIN